MGIFRGSILIFQGSFLHFGGEIAQSPSIFSSWRGGGGKSWAECLWAKKIRSCTSLRNELTLAKVERGIKLMNWQANPPKIDWVQKQYLGEGQMPPCPLPWRCHCYYPNASCLSLYVCEYVSIHMEIPHFVCVNPLRPGGNSLWGLVSSWNTIAYDPHNIVLNHLTLTMECWYDCPLCKGCLI